MSLGSGELERLTIRLAGLANDISRDAASSDCVGSFEVVSGQDSGVRANSGHLQAARLPLQSL